MDIFGSQFHAIFLDLRLGSSEDILAGLNIGCDAEANTLGSIVFAVAVATEDLALSLAEHRAVHSLVADLASKAGLVEGLASSPHHLRNEHSLFTPWADVCTAPFWLRLWTPRSWSL